MDPTTCTCVCRVVDDVTAPSNWIKNCPIKRCFSNNVFSKSHWAPVMKPIGQVSTDVDVRKSITMSTLVVIPRQVNLLKLHTSRNRQDRTEVHNDDFADTRDMMYDVCSNLDNN